MKLLNALLKLFGYQIIIIKIIVGFAGNIEIYKYKLKLEKIKS